MVSHDPYWQIVERLEAEGKSQGLKRVGTKITQKMIVNKAREIFPYINSGKILFFNPLYWTLKEVDKVEPNPFDPEQPFAAEAPSIEGEFDEEKALLVCLEWLAKVIGMSGTVEQLGGKRPFLRRLQHALVNVYFEYGPAGQHRHREWVKWVKCLEEEEVYKFERDGKTYYEDGDFNSFAKDALGFKSEAEMEEVTEIVAECHGEITWHITKMPNGRYAAWNTLDFYREAVKFFDTFEEALDYQWQNFNDTRKQMWWVEDEDWEWGWPDYPPAAQA